MLFADNLTYRCLKKLVLGTRRWCRENNPIEPGVNVDHFVDNSLKLAQHVPQLTKCLRTDRWWIEGESEKSLLPIGAMHLHRAPAQLLPIFNNVHVVAQWSLKKADSDAANVYGGGASIPDQRNAMGLPF